MAYYNYKYVRDQLPAWITDEIRNYEGDANYDGDQWIAASNYIDYLELVIKKLDPNFDPHVKP